MTKKAVITLIILITLLAVYFIAFKVVRVQDIILKSIYPIEYSEYVFFFFYKNGV